MAETVTSYREVSGEEHMRLARYRNSHVRIPVEKLSRNTVTVLIRAKGNWAEGASVVWSFPLETLLQNRSMDKTRNSIRSLMNRALPEVWVKTSSEYVLQPVLSVGIVDIVLVKPGGRILLDGEVVKGESTVNQALITGESIQLIRPLELRSMRRQS